MICRPRFSVRKLLLSVTLVGLLVGLGRAFSDHLQLRSEVDFLRGQLGGFEMSDPASIYVRRLPPGGRFRVYLPESPPFEVLVAEMGAEIRPLGVLAQRPGGCTMVLNLESTERGQELTFLSARGSETRDLSILLSQPTWLPRPLGYTHAEELDPNEPVMLLNQPYGDKRLLVLLRPAAPAASTSRADTLKP